MFTYVVYSPQQLMVIAAGDAITELLDISFYLILNQTNTSSF